MTRTFGLVPASCCPIRTTALKDLTLANHRRVQLPNVAGHYIEARRSARSSKARSSVSVSVLSPCRSDALVWPSVT